MLKIGKIGKANREARKLIAEKAEEMNLCYCELRLEGCVGTFGLAPAHRHPRVWYNGNVNKLSDVKQWVAGCQWCHNKIDTNNNLKDKKFLELRGQE